MNEMDKRLKYFSRILLGLYIIAVCLLCFMRFSTGIDMSSTWFGIPKDKVVHGLMFFPFPILMSMAFFRANGRPLKRIVFLTVCIIIGAIAGGAIELIQQETGYRSGDVLDFRADCIGLMTGAVLMLAYAAILKKW